MTLVWGLSRLLDVDEEELRSRVQWANQQTFAPFFSLYQSVAPVLGLVHTPEVPVPHVMDEPSPLSACSLAEQLPFSQDHPGVQVLEQNQGYSESVAFSSACPGLDTLKSAEKELPLVICEQNLCGKGVAMPLRAIEQNEGINAADVQTAGSTLASSTTGSVVQLNRDSFSQILAHADESTLQACSLVCRDFLELSSFARIRMSLQKCPQITVLPKLLARFSQLQILHIKGPLDLQPATACFNDPAMSIIARCKSLRELRIGRYSEFSDEGLATVLTGCSELLMLRLVHCGGFNGEAFNGLVCKLETLELSTCVGMTSEGFLAAATACPRLKTFGVATDQRDASLALSLEGAARTCRGLRELTLHACGVTNGTLRCFATSCPTLVEVTISCEHLVTDAGLADFFALLPGLKSATLTNNRLLTQVPRFGPGRSLKRLSLRCWSPDVVLRPVAMETNLEELLLLVCLAVTDATVKDILAGCRNLKRLVLQANDLVTMETVNAYLRSGSTARLEVERCANIRKESLPEEARQSSRICVT